LECLCLFQFLQNHKSCDATHTTMNSTVLEVDFLLTLKHECKTSWSHKSFLILKISCLYMFAMLKHVLASSPFPSFCSRSFSSLAIMNLCLRKVGGHSTSSSILVRHQHTIEWIFPSKPPVVRLLGRSITIQQYPLFGCYKQTKNDEGRNSVDSWCFQKLSLQITFHRHHRRHWQGWELLNLT
jgi:hypothetical protein